MIELENSRHSYMKLPLIYELRLLLEYIGVQSQLLTFYAQHFTIIFKNCYMPDIAFLLFQPVYYLPLRR